MTLSSTSLFPQFSTEKTPFPGQGQATGSSSQDNLARTQEFLSQFQTPQAPAIFSAFSLEQSPNNDDTGDRGKYNVTTKRLVSPPQPTQYPTKPVMTQP